MALIKCSECGKDISDKANTCPNCGCPIEKEKKKIRIVKNGGLALRCNVFIDNQAVGQIGIGSQKSIELWLPIGTHYISTITQVKNQTNIIGGNGTNTFVAPITTSTSQEQDGKQFEVKKSDELIEIEILTKGSFTGSTGRCVVGNIKNYNANEISAKNDEIRKQETKENTKNNIIDKIINFSILIVIVLLIIFLLKVII